MVSKEVDSLHGIKLTLNVSELLRFASSRTNSHTYKRRHAFDAINKC